MRAAAIQLNSTADVDRNLATAERLVDSAAAGIRANVQSIVYQGGHFRVDAMPDAGTDIALHFIAGEPCSLRAGDAITLAIDDGWVIPGPARSHA